MKVILTDFTENPEMAVAKAAAICYSADRSDEACAKRLKNLIKMKHLATLRFAYATFHIDGISRITSHQLVRSKHLDFLQESQRYVNQDDISFVQPESLTDPELALAWAKLEQASKDVYALALAKGMKKEDARFALLHSAPTKINVTGNFQAWRDFITLRSVPVAQWEIRTLAHKIAVELNRIAPNIFGDLI